MRNCHLKTFPRPKPKMSVAVLKVFGLTNRRVYLWPFSVERPITRKQWRTVPEEA